jgi:hypothetical protein
VCRTLQLHTTCCILHNILLHHDGYDARWKKGVNWEGQDGHHEVDDISSIFKRHRMRVAQTTTTDFSLVGINAVAHNYSIVHGDEVEEIEPHSCKFESETDRSFLL